MLRPEIRLVPDSRDSAVEFQQRTVFQDQAVGRSLGLGNERFQQSLPQVVPTIRKGVVDGFIKTCERWGLSKAEQVILLGYMGDELGAEQIFRSRIRASRDVVDRTGYVLGISIGLAALFNESIAAEKDWLRRPNPKLNNAIPLAVMLDGKMISLITIFNLVNYERAL